MQTVTKAFVDRLYPQRKPDAHKGDFGKLLVIGGSDRYSGAPALAALAAYRSGCDLVAIAAPERAATIAASFSPDLMTVPLAGSSITKKHLGQILRLAETATAIVIGNGMERQKETEHFFVRFIKSITKPAVIDGDGLYFLSRHEDLLTDHFVLTPHAKEFLVLTGADVGKAAKEKKIDVMENILKKASTTILLKGNPDIISDGKNMAINETGNPFMTVGGTGDCLAGTVGALLARGAKPFEAACAGAYIIGAAGDRAAKKYGESLMASDVIAEIPNVLR